MTEPFRYRLILGKYPVIKVEPSLTRIYLTLQVKNKLFLTTECPLTSDVRLGDLLTLYTEVLSNAVPQVPPKQ